MYKHILSQALAYLDRGDGVGLAYDLAPGRSPTLVFLPGFMSDMTGDKATMLAAFCAELGHACLRLDYSGHGGSGGRFEDGTIGRWTEDALCLIDRLVPSGFQIDPPGGGSPPTPTLPTRGRGQNAQGGTIILVGSSMGGWIALLVALARPGRIAAVIGVAAAPDCTETLMWDCMTAAERAALAQDGLLRLPSTYGGEQVITRTLIEEGRRHLLLGASIPITCPVRLLHGQQDPDVPWQTALKLAAALTSVDVTVTLIKDGDHRLSRPQDLGLLRETLRLFLLQDGA